MGCASSTLEVVDTLDLAKKTPEMQADIASYIYFPGYGRASKLAFVMDKAKIKFEFKPMNPIAWGTT